MKRFFLILLLTASAQAAEVDHGEMVEQFHTTLTAAMAESEFQRRVELLQPAVKELFDLDRIASLSLGSKWRELDEAQRGEFIDVLYRLIVATYANRFAEYPGQVFATESIQQARRGTVVRTRLTTVDREVQLDYFFRQGRVFNVAADGVSDLSLRRSDYKSVIASEGYNGLIDNLQRQIREAEQP